VAIVRTTLLDSGIGEGVIEMLRKEVEAAKARQGPDGDDAELGDRAYTVEVTAMATLCNLIADFSPFKQVSLSLSRRNDNFADIRNS
jgi:hypothetical protein